MSSLLTTLLVSFSKLLFSSHTLVLMANQSLFKPIHSASDETYTSAELQFGATVVHHALLQEKVSSDHQAFGGAGKEEYGRRESEVGRAPLPNIRH